MSSRADAWHGARQERDPVISYTPHGPGDLDLDDDALGIPPRRPVALGVATLGVLHAFGFHPHTATSLERGPTDPINLTERHGAPAWPVREHVSHFA